jgi:hypothetical protein
VRGRSDWLQVNKCLSIKGAEDVLNKPHAFELSTTEDSMFFIAETVKVDTLIYSRYTKHAEQSDASWMNFL